MVCALAVGLKFKIGLDDSLDVVAVHFVGGLWGTLSLGFFALPSAKTEGGLFHGGGLAQFWPQLLTALIVTVWSAVMTTLIGFAIHKTIGMRVSEADEHSGIDVTEHAETAYELLMVGGSFNPGEPHAALASAEADGARMESPVRQRTGSRPGPRDEARGGRPRAAPAAAQPRRIPLNR